MKNAINCNKRSGNESCRRKEGRKEGHGKIGRRNSFGNTKIDVGLVTDKPHKVEMSKKKRERGGRRKVIVAITVVVVDHQSSCEFVSEIKPCQQEFRANAFVSTL
jgi:hypothetical protein